MIPDNASRVAVRPQLLAQLGEILLHHRVAELAPKLEAAGIPYAPIVRPDQLVDEVVGLALPRGRQLNDPRARVPQPPQGRLGAHDVGVVAGVRGQRDR